jgi:hypothetical protein
VILRRVAEHIRQQHWTGVLIELVIVVLGVFIGMQVSNWNQERVTDEQAAVFTERLKADLRGEDWSYQFLLTYNREVLANANRAVDALEGRATLSDEALLIAAYRATQYRQRNRRGATYDELISTGTIGLIRNQTLRDTAMRLYTLSTFDNLAREGMQSHYRETFRITLPNNVQRALGKHCGDHVIRPGDYAAMPGNLDYPCGTGLSTEEIAASAKALRANPDVVRFLRLRIADLETRLFDLTGNNREIMENLRAIANAKP